MVQDQTSGPRVCGSKAQIKFSFSLSFPPNQDLIAPFSSLAHKFFMNMYNRTQVQA